MWVRLGSSEAGNMANRVIGDVTQELSLTLSPMGHRKGNAVVTLLAKICFSFC
jgi:hypothetical protein